VISEKGREEKGGKERGILKCRRRGRGEYASRCVSVAWYGTEVS
jgi:hypothetical protein